MTQLTYRVGVEEDAITNFDPASEEFHASLNYRHATSEDEVRAAYRDTWQDSDSKGAAGSEVLVKVQSVLTGIGEWEGQFNTLLPVGVGAAAGIGLRGANSRLSNFRATPSDGPWLAPTFAEALRIWASAASHSTRQFNRPTDSGGRELFGEAEDGPYWISSLFDMGPKSAVADSVSPAAETFLQTLSTGLPTCQFASIQPDPFVPDSVTSQPNLGISCTRFLEDGSLVTMPPTINTGILNRDGRLDGWEELKAACAKNMSALVRYIGQHGGRWLENGANPNVLLPIFRVSPRHPGTRTLGEILPFRADGAKETRAYQHMKVINVFTHTYGGVVTVLSWLDINPCSPVIFHYHFNYAADASYRSHHRYTPSHRGTHWAGLSDPFKESQKALTIAGLSGMMPLREVMGLVQVGDPNFPAARGEIYSLARAMSSSPYNPVGPTRIGIGFDIPTPDLTRVLQMFFAKRIQGGEQFSGMGGTVSRLAREEFEEVIAYEFLMLATLQVGERSPSFRDQRVALPAFHEGVMQSSGLSRLLAQRGTGGTTSLSDTFLQRTRLGFIPSKLGLLDLGRGSLLAAVQVKLEESTPDREALQLSIDTMADNLRQREGYLALRFSHANWIKVGRQCSAAAASTTARLLDERFPGVSGATKLALFFGVLSAAIPKVYSPTLGSQTLNYNWGWGGTANFADTSSIGCRINGYGSAGDNSSCFGPIPMEGASEELLILPAMTAAAVKAQDQILEEAMKQIPEGENELDISKAIARPEFFSLLGIPG